MRSKTLKVLVSKRFVFMSEAIYISKKCSHTMRNFKASQMYVIKDHSIDLQF